MNAYQRNEIERILWSYKCKFLTDIPLNGENSCVYTIEDTVTRKIYACKVKIVTQELLDSSREKSIERINNEVKILLIKS